ncbi:response regulator transcription factor [Enterococcus sp. 669A]|uniref:Response regulator transcription factor n=1 Tax=Candidatus Enterococcus moelleringii TaxID=2815325 RepID=A0ABS3LBI2_9ENTE|nr:LytTR family DNA-binding domain-containing protein [Enterococcus sp. 669A]MBO1306999.1 response regulator transcription factor [Enterococcus sp. 669A]
MLKIAICEDKQKDLDYLEKGLNQLLTEKKVPYIINTYTTGQGMLKVLEKEQFDIYFIDIYLDEVSGILLAQKIRSMNRLAAIVFITSSAQHMAEGYRIGVLHYLLKPFTLEELQEALERALRIIPVEERKTKLVVHRKNVEVLHRDIHYVEIQNRSCTLYTSQGEKMVYCSLNELEEKLDDPRFLRCHRSFLVNMEWITSIEERDFVVDGEKKVPINRESASKLKASYVRFRLNKVRERG